jgi:membrane protease YdiL (CAAX protease family)
MTDVLELTGSAMLAVVASTVLQFSYHLYYGWIGALSLSMGFLVSSLYYLRTRRATPIIVAHGIVDLAGLARLWLR